MKTNNFFLQTPPKNSHPAQPFFQHVTSELLFGLVLTGPALLVLVGAVFALIALYTVSIGKVAIALYFPLVSYVLAAAVATARNPMHALLALIGVFVSAVVIYITAGAQFLGLVFLIVYVGAVAILFLFVVMLLNVNSLIPKKEVPLLQHASQFATLAVVGALFIRLMTGLVPATNRTVLTNNELLSSHEATTAEAVNQYVTQQAGDIFIFSTLYTEHGSPFGLITQILLIAMLGAIVLANKTHEEEHVIKGLTTSVTTAVAVVENNLASRKFIESTKVKMINFIAMTVIVSDNDVIGYGLVNISPEFATIFTQTSTIFDPAAFNLFLLLALLTRLTNPERNTPILLVGPVGGGEAPPALSSDQNYQAICEQAKRMSYADGLAYDRKLQAENRSVQNQLHEAWTNVDKIKSYLAHHYDFNNTYLKELLRTEQRITKLNHVYKSNGQIREILNRECIGPQSSYYTPPPSPSAAKPLDAATSWPNPPVSAPSTVLPTPPNLSTPPAASNPQPLDPSLFANVDWGKWGVVCLGILGVVGLCVAAFKGYQRRTAPEPTPQPPVQPTIEPPTTPQSTGPTAEIPAQLPINPPTPPVPVDVSPYDCCEACQAVTNSIELSGLQIITVILLLFCAAAIFIEENILIHYEERVRPLVWEYRARMRILYDDRVLPLCEQYRVHGQLCYKKYIYPTIRWCRNQLRRR